jgi:Dolichyl-phosphate-mannose-protein mannosyltransferase
MSLAAVPVYVYGRRLMPPSYALAAAALTLASPLLLYTGLLMTEVLYYPLAAWTLLATAHAIATGTRRDFALALVLVAACVLTRSQAVVLVAVLLLALCLDAAFGRSFRRLRPFWPLAVVFVVGAVVLAAEPGLLGSYAVTLQGSYPLGSALHFTLEHLALAILTTAVLPAVALCLLTIEAVRGRIAEPELRSVVATSLAAVVLISLQVGFFAARFAPHLLERDLAALPPLLFTVLAAWVARGSVRPVLATTAVVLGIGVFVLAMPWDRLVNPIAFADSFSLLLPYRMDDREPVVFVVLIVVILLLCFVFMPRRASAGFLVVPFALLVATSAVASNRVAGLVRSVQRDFVGPDPSWIDHAAGGNVTYLYDGESYWNVVWQEQFWNRRITQVVYAATPVPGPIDEARTYVGIDGRLNVDTRYVVATDYHYFVGTPIAHLDQIGLDASGLTLWKLQGAPRLSYELFGFQPNGDITFPVTVKVFDCGGGALQLTLLTKATRRLRITLDGNTVVDEHVLPNSIWRGSVPGPRGRAAKVCIYKIVPQQLLGSTVIDFQRPSTSG